MTKARKVDLLYQWVIIITDFSNCFNGNFWNVILSQIGVSRNSKGKGACRYGKKTRQFKIECAFYIICAF